MTPAFSFVSFGLAITLSPLLLGVIQKTKAFFAGREGAPLMQPYFDFVKLFRKGGVYSRTTSWVFWAGPIANLAAALLSLTFVPLGRIPAPAAFPGDVFMVAYSLSLGRFLMVLAALDTGSAFEGMGASREVRFSLLAEPVFFVSVLTLAVVTQGASLSEIYGTLPRHMVHQGISTIWLAGGAVALVLLVENARIPVDDPTTHLELTMIHEAMVLDHGGIDIGFVQYGAALKLWMFSALVAGAFFPFSSARPFLEVMGGIGGVFAVAVAVGIVESSMARLRLIRVPQLILLAGVLALMALLWAAR